MASPATVAARLGVGLALLLLGAAMAVATVGVHRLAWGLPLGLTATVAALVATPGGWWRRLPLALGWSAMVGWLAMPRPEGDYAIASDTRGYLLIATAVVVLVVGVATVPVRPRTIRGEDGSLT